MASREPARFDAGELAVVLSHYELGVIESITDFPRGSRRSPKAGIVAERGKFLLKRRTLGRVPPERIRFTHRVQQKLIEAGFPAPRLVATRQGMPMLQLRDYVYELFEFVAGEPYRRTVPETQEAGATLARFHELTESVDPDAEPGAPRGDFHDAPGVRTGLCGIGANLSSHDSFSGDEAELAGLTQALLTAYDDAAEAVNAAGGLSGPDRVIHSDWHPGNLVFRNQTVVGVIDYDSMRVSQEIVDVANGALQFSIIAGGDPATWPEALDEERFQAFLGGYRGARGLGEKAGRCVVPLMIEALIAECVAPIAQTGSVGPWAGFRVLQMVRRKVAWLSANAARLAGAVSA